MRTISTIAANGSRRAPLPSVKSVMAARAGRSFVIAMVSAFCVGGMAMTAPAPPAPTDLLGRWVAEKTKLTLDVSRCGEDWCGVEVKADGVCGRTTLRLTPYPQDQTPVSM